ncbi:MAG: ATP-dependent Clp protease ATP-binding subunit ClpX, partial [Acutalibacteraceae bacterium]
SLVKQYKKLFSLDKVELEFTDEALRAVAKKAIERNIGARGLRSIMEEILTDVMFNVPSDHTIEKVIINEKVVQGDSKPEYIRDESRQPVIISINDGGFSKIKKENANN